jgi:hypothetical protein
MRSARKVLHGIMDTALRHGAIRRTVATMLDDAGIGTGAIATALGQDPVTTSSYVKTKRVGDAAAVALSVAF